EAGQETLQVEPQVALRRRFTPSVPSPVHAVGYKLNHRGVHCVDGALEAPGKPLVASRWTKPGSLVLQVRGNLPEQLLHHGAVAVPIGMRQSVAAWGC